MRENCQIFRFIGLLDAFSELSFRKVVSSYIDQGPKNLVFGLDKIEFIDSSGLGALVQIVKKVRDEGGTVQIVTNPRVTQTVKLVRLEKYLSLKPSLEEALAAVESNN